MIRYFLWYLTFGFVLVSVYGIGVIIGLHTKYGWDIASRGVKLSFKKDVQHGKNLYEEVANVIIGILVWPARLSAAPDLTERMHERCEELLNESKKSAT